jgi:NADPH:quinone reductase-like Zn-dependent oxidoreductase
MALGVEAAGVVAAVGAGVEGGSVGDEVLTQPLPLVDQGTWAPWLIAEAKLLVRKPVKVSWAPAGAFAVAALTAIQVLDEGLRVKPGERLLVNGAGGVTGGLIVAFASLRGLRVFATAGPVSRERVLRAGAATVVDYHDADWTAQILEATPAGESMLPPTWSGVAQRVRSQPFETAVVSRRSPRTRRRANEELESPRCMCARTRRSSNSLVRRWPPDAWSSNSLPLSRWRKRTQRWPVPSQAEGAQSR